VDIPTATTFSPSAWSVLIYGAWTLTLLAAIGSGEVWPKSIQHPFGGARALAGAWWIVSAHAMTMSRRDR